MLRLTLLIVLALAAGMPLRASYATEIATLQKEIRDLEAEREQVLREMAQGLYCSQCMKGKTEIERREPFEQHLRDVNGQPVPASANTINMKIREYERRIEALRRRIAELEKRAEEAEERAFEREQRAHEERLEGMRAEAEQRAARDHEIGRRESERDAAMARTSKSGIYALPPGPSPEQLRRQGQMQLASSLATMIGTFARQFEERREARQAEEAAARREDEERRMEIRRRVQARQQRQEQDRAAEAERQESAKRDWFDTARRQMDDSLSNFAWYTPENRTKSIAERLGGYVAIGTALQVAQGQSPDPVRSIRGGILHEVQSATRDFIVDQLPAEHQTSFRISRALRSWTTLNPLRIWSSYNDIMRQDIFAEMDKITSDLPAEP